MIDHCKAPAHWAHSRWLRSGRGLSAGVEASWTDASTSRHPWVTDDGVVEVAGVVGYGSDDVGLIGESEQVDESALPS